MITFSAAANIGRKLNIDLIKTTPSSSEMSLGGLLKTKSSSKHIEVYSRTILTHLDAGDKLFIRQAAGINNGVYSDWEKQTSYAGFLVYPDSNLFGSIPNQFKASTNSQNNLNSTDHSRDMKSQSPRTKSSMPSVDLKLDTEATSPNGIRNQQTSSGQMPNAEALKTWFKSLYSGLKIVSDKWDQPETFSTNQRTNWDPRSSSSGAHTKREHNQGQVKDSDQNSEL